VLLHRFVKHTFGSADKFRVRKTGCVPLFASALRRVVWVAALVIGVLVATVVGTTSAFAASTRPSATHFHSGPTPHAELLFVTSAGSGSLQAKAGSATTYALTLDGLDRNVVWFTDHPARRAGTVQADAFVGDWSGYGFKADPPNAALVLDSAHPGHDTAVGALSSLTFDPESGRLQADFTVYRGQQLKGVHGALADKVRRATGAVLPASFGGATLFIDDAWEPIINAVRFPQQVTTQTAENLVGTPGNPVQFSSANGAPVVYEFGSVQGSLAGSTFDGPLVFTTPSLAGVNLSDVTQVGTGSIFFTVTDFTDTDLQGADLPDATFLSGADFDGADLQGATLGQTPGAMTDADTTCTNGAPGPCNGPGLTSG
jgi:Pentapeptide repeats (8 copies)